MDEAFTKCEQCKTKAGIVTHVRVVDGKMVVVARYCLACSDKITREMIDAD